MNMNNYDNPPNKVVIDKLLLHLTTARGQIAETSHFHNDTYELVQARVTRELDNMLEEPADIQTLRAFLLRGMLELNVCTPFGATDWYFHQREWSAYFLYILKDILELNPGELQDLESGTGVYDDAADYPAMLRLLMTDRIYTEKFDKFTFPEVVRDKYEHPEVLEPDEIPKDLLTFWIFDHSFVGTSVLNLGIMIADRIEDEFPLLTSTQLRRIVAQGSYLEIYRRVVLPFTYNAQLNKLINVTLPGAFHSVLAESVRDIEVYDKPQVAIECLNPNDQKVNSAILLTRSFMSTLLETADDAVYSILMDDVFAIMGVAKELMVKHNGKLPTDMEGVDFTDQTAAVGFFRSGGLNALEFLLTHYTKVIIMAMRVYYQMPSKILDLSPALKVIFANQELTTEEKDTITIYAGYGLLVVFFEYAINNITLQSCTALHTMLYGAGITTELGFTLPDTKEYYSGFEVTSALTFAANNTRQTPIATTSPQENVNVFQAYLDELDEEGSQDDNNF